MESIQQPISQRKRNWIIAAALSIGCIWGMLVFYSIVDRNQDDLTVAPKGSYAPQTPAPAAIGSSSFYQAPRYNAPQTGYHSPALGVRLYACAECCDGQHLVGHGDACSSNQ